MDGWMDGWVDITTEEWIGRYLIVKSMVVLW